ncbi:MAG TPA: molybdopterin dinucleotide binding domain-containing protein, partial [Candidatus Eisenbacteria bacterium]|nr:molybdopterin dinucleotide binding domain-containing protein [Candidatus Eisenbacteria bacterium]
ANPASNHPRLMTQLANLRARGGHVIVVNPLREPALEKFHVPSQIKSLFFGTEIASVYIQPFAGGDVAYLVGVLKSLIEKNRINEKFLAANTDGSKEALDYARQLSWDEVVEGSGVSREEMERSATLLADSKNAIFAWAMGLTHHAWGVENVLAVANLALATGHVGKPGAGMLPIRGHSNVQGVGSVGFTPELQDKVRRALESAYGRQLPTESGLDTYAMIEAAERGEIKTLFCLGGNLWGSNPDSEWASRAMQNIDTTIYLSTKLNPGHFYGRAKTTLILPVLARDEEPQPTSQESMFNFVRLSEGGDPNVKGYMRSESEVICDLANRVLGQDPVDWLKLKDHKQVRELISKTIPGWKEIAEIDATKTEFTIPGRVYHHAKFSTASGNARMHKTPLPTLKKDGLSLITLRSEGQFNTVVYEEHDLYRGIPHRHCVLVSSEDAGKLKIKDGQRVTVRGEAGKMDNIEVVVGKIKPGAVAMFYPESNVLIKGNIDPRSKTPAFKSAPVWIDP